MQDRNGFTIIDLLISMAIFALVSVSFIVIFVAIVNVETHQSSQAEVTQQNQYLVTQLQNYIGNARLVDMTLDTPAAMLTLRMASSTIDPTIIYATGGAIYVQQGAAAAQVITSNRVSISSVSFTRHYNLGSSTAYGTESVSFSYTISENTANVRQAYSKSFQSSATVLAPVPKIALLQQAEAQISAPSISTIYEPYGSANESGDLLLAVVANTTDTAAATISDTAGNTWSKLDWLTYPAYNEQITAFAAVNAKNSTNTVTATLPSGAGNASLFLYEYRGAATSSSFDVSSTQLQAANQSPSSGSVTPSSALELLFGATYNSTGETPTPESGFTSEESSSVSQVYTEDMTQYIAGPVAATWVYTNTTPSSSALIMTFQ